MSSNTPDMAQSLMQGAQTKHDSQLFGLFGLCIGTFFKLKYSLEMNLLSVYMNYSRSFSPFYY